MHSLRGDVNQQTGRRWPALPLIALAFLLVATATPMLFGSDRGDDISRIQNADEVFKAIMNTPDKAIPQELLESAKCIAIIPGEVKAGFMFGGQYGKGLAVCRTPHGWSAPAFLTVAGGSVGFQIGASSTDVVMIFRNNQGLARLLSDKFKIGADATAAAGPVGRTASAGTDLEMHAEILTYARSRGAFAGVSLNGAVVKADHSGDRALYGRRVMREQILDGQVRVPGVAEPLVAEITHYAAGTRTVASSR
jgi:lipid-binding SYLF domain-containing protein